MKFDELNVEQLEARRTELAGMDTESATRAGGAGERARSHHG